MGRKLSSNEQQTPNNVNSVKWAGGFSVLRFALGLQMMCTEASWMKSHNAIEWNLPSHAEIKKLSALFSRPGDSNSQIEVFSFCSVNNDA